MEQQFISGRQILLLGFLITFFSIYTAFVQFTKSDYISICNEQSGMTLVIVSESNYPIVASEGALKDILSCIGKSTPYYSRVIETFLSSSFEKQQKLEERYTINSKVLQSEDIDISFYNNLYLLRTERQLIVVGMKNNISAFLLEKYLTGSDSIVVYMPENSPIIDEMTRKIVANKGGSFYTIKTGEKRLNPLF